MVLGFTKVEFPFTTHKLVQTVPSQPLSTTELFLAHSILFHRNHELRSRQKGEAEVSARGFFMVTQIDCCLACYNVF